MSEPTTRKSSTRPTAPLEKGNGFIAQITDTFQASLTPAYEDVFTTAEGQINLVFARHDKGKISGFVFNSALGERAVKDIVFKRSA